MHFSTKEFPDALKDRINASYHFSSALKRLKDGKEATPRSWVYENKSSDWIRDQWANFLRQASNEDVDLKDVYEWDLSKLDKFAEQGGVAPFNDRLETLDEYWAHLDTSSVFDSALWKQAIKQAVKLLGFNESGVPASVQAVIDRGIAQDKYNTSSGDPLFKKRKSPEAIAEAKESATNGNWKSRYPVLGSRASMGKTGEAARWIFMFPMSVNLKEQTFQQPLQDYIRQKQIEFFAPWDGFSRVQKIVSANFEGRLKFGADYSKMDQHFNLHHALQCFEVIKHYFQPKYWNDLKESIEYTFNCDVIAPDYLIKGPHAMPSGSGWTNFLETVFNFILIQYLKLLYHLPIVTAMGIGDDQLWFLEFQGDIAKLTDLVVTTFEKVGLSANAEKQEVGYGSTGFLQRHFWSNYSRNGIRFAAVYPTIRALTSEVFPEFYHNEKEWTSRTFALRCLMILENCCNHPKFKEFCIFIAEGNKNIREFITMDPVAQRLVQKRAKSIANFIPTYNQEKQDLDVTQFLSVKLLREHYHVA